MEYGICDVIGSGLGNNPYRPLIGEYGFNYLAIIPEDRRCAFIKCYGGDGAAALADPGIFRITLGLQDTLTAGQASTANTRLSRWSIQAQASAGMTVRQVLIDIIQELDVTADFTKLRLDGNE